MTPATFIARLGQPGHTFADTLSFIEQHYAFTPSAFDNGPLHNTAEQNQGSCKVLALALDLELSNQQALQCFAEHYQSVLADPHGNKHGNIRALMQHGLSQVRFTHSPLIRV
ncbi:HopJ type III effector protein [Halopseudomonas salegens]|uniref:HopJ type III effector protein n=1 Tax=Halopseudomonas salegens TaxID=1434072 RepID=A0A1H2EA02_9GAMM|nr:HopJ type III effector protein [Halopseudomonas salegens]SDT91884.1 HopJ type III effector protein [Halopseudomonas salegens]